MFTLTHISQETLIEKKSRFLAIAGPVANDIEAASFIAAHSDPDANHNCWAWRIGQAYRFSDDGEPSGTAGKPILQAIDGQSLDGVAVVVTRWFGGILLGSGGLMRAYGGTAAQCLRAAEKSEIIERRNLVLELGFSDHPLIRNRLQSIPNLVISAERFGAFGVEIDIAVPVSEIVAMVDMATNLTSGRARIIDPDA